MSIDTRGTGFIRVTDLDGGEHYNISVRSIESFNSVGGDLKIFPIFTTEDCGWIVQESEQEILDKIREAMAEPWAAQCVVGDIPGDIEIQDFRPGKIARSASTPAQVVPDWRWVPKRWRYFAIDDDGRGTFYEFKPGSSDEGFWIVHRGDFTEAGFFNPAGWENSLQQRPEGV